MVISLLLSFLTDFNNSRPQAVHYAEQTPKYNGSAQLNNALKTYLAPLRDQPTNFQLMKILSLSLR